MAHPNDWAFDQKSVHLVNLYEAEHMSIGHLVRLFLPFILQMMRYVLTISLPELLNFDVLFIFISDSIKVAGVR